MTRRSLGFASISEQRSCAISALGLPLHRHFQLAIIISDTHVNGRDWTDIIAGRQRSVNVGPEM